MSVPRLNALKQVVSVNGFVRPPFTQSVADILGLQGSQGRWLLSACFIVLSLLIQINVKKECFLKEKLP